MKKSLYYFVIGLLISSCGKSGSSFPAGTTVTYEVSSTNDTIAVIQYFNATESVESYTHYLSNNWSYTFQTTKDDQLISLQATALTYNYQVTGELYVDGVLEKQATGTSISLTYP